MSKRIVRLSARNVLRLSAVDIEPSGNVVILGGKNGSGKTSVLNAIRIALGGKRNRPEKLIREGAESAEVLLDLDDLLVEYHATRKTERIVVRSKDGARYDKPQALLDRLFNAVTFDPLACSRKKPEEQAEEVRKLVGLDLSDLDAQYREVYAERKGLNREVRDLQGVAATMPHHDEAPEDEVSVAGLLRELQDGEKLAAENDKAREKLSEWKQSVAAVNTTIVDDRERIARLERELADAQSDLRLHTDQLASVQAMRDTQQAEVDALTDPDLDAIREKMAATDDTNRQVRENQARVAKYAEAEAKQTEADRLTERLNEIKTEREKRIAAVEFPVPGLGFDENGITLNGHPLKQASKAEQIRFWVAFGVAANPELRAFLIEDASVLDEESLEQLAGFAAEHDADVWLEDTRTKDPAAIIIEDGRRVDAEPEQKAG